MHANIILLYFAVSLGNNMLVQTTSLKLYQVFDVLQLVSGLLKSWCMWLRSFSVVLMVKMELQSGSQGPLQLAISSSYVEMAFKQRACQILRILTLISLASEWVHFMNNSSWNQRPILDATPLLIKNCILTSNVMLNYNLTIIMTSEENLVFQDVTFKLDFLCIQVTKSC